ncbi:DUF2933 domain-containing protein [Pseudaestuariivita atlantica]|uniref:DUF2933 domain-containing protein n=1 Tax=Pseudaestuariivita atlantica TaxID=1317121 RepID=A0A0L1JS63_9RHOB|nr:DUF2933 domain-containing protein [Pseudaestuariivita atlantica]KNG94576.1 hypothetical protein ATO11_03985 [Pseudaestuariivita atlantica]
MTPDSDRQTDTRTGGGTQPPPVRKSRAGIYLLVALALGGLVLGYAYRDLLPVGSWFIWLPLLICVGMHFFMHGGHGGHGGHDHKGGDTS